MKCASPSGDEHHQVRRTGVRVKVITNRLENALTRVVAWVRRHGYRGYEPADGNASVLFPLTGGKVMPMRVLQQVVLRAPFNVRPFLGVAPHESPIGRGYMAWGYLTMS